MSDTFSRGFLDSNFGSNVDIGFSPADFLKSSHPELVQDFWSKVGLTEDKQGYDKQGAALAMDPLNQYEKASTPDMMSLGLQSQLSLPQLVSMIESYNKQPEPRGLMAPAPQQNTFGLWG